MTEEREQGVQNFRTAFVWLLTTRHSILPQILGTRWVARQAVLVCEKIEENSKCVYFLSTSTVYSNRATSSRETPVRLPLS